MRKQHRTLSWVALLAASLVVGACKKVEDKLPPYDPVVSAIERIGLDKLKKASEFSARYLAQGPGHKIKGKAKVKGGAVRIEWVIPYGDLVVQTAGPEHCWRQRGKVVIPCDPEMRKHMQRLGSLLEAAWIWPLDKHRHLTAKSSPTEIDGKTYDNIVISSGGTELGSLLFDRDKAVVVGLKMQTTLGGKTGEFAGTFSKLEKTCGGVLMPTKREYTFMGQKLVTETIDGALCEKLDDKLFQKPEQVKDGLVALKHKGTSTLACKKLKGPYSGVPNALKEVRAYLAQINLPPVGPPFLVHYKAPPKVKRPAGFLTDVCWPVGKKAWVMPKNLWKKGKFTLYDDEGDEVLSAYGTGDVTKTSTELPPLLYEGAKIRKRPPSKEPLIQILHNYRDDIPADQQTSEMQMVLQ